MKSEFLVRALFPTASPEQVAEFTAEQVEAAKAAANSLGMVKGICTSGVSYYLSLYGEIAHVPASMNASWMVDLICDLANFSTT